MKEKRDRKIIQNLLWEWSRMIGKMKRIVEKNNSLDKILREQIIFYKNIDYNQSNWKGILRPLSTEGLK